MMNNTTFGVRARARMAEYGPACLGIDPHPSLLEAWGLNDSVDGLQRFTDIAVEALAGQVAFLKPQSAFYERHGAAGMAILEAAIGTIRQRGTLVILDAKRGDIGTTAAAYARAYLDQTSPMAVDAMTVSPYLGFGSLAPFFDVAQAGGAGVFVLALTSNPEGPEVQTARWGPESVAGAVLRQLANLNAGAEPMGSMGAVVGATIGQTSEDLAINGPLLVPGLGAQGGTVGDIGRLFSTVRDCVIPATSRAVLAAGPEVESLRSAAQSVNRSVNRALTT